MSFVRSSVDNPLEAPAISGTKFAGNRAAATSSVQLAKNTSKRDAPTLSVDILPSQFLRMLISSSRLLAFVPVSSCNKPGMVSTARCATTSICISFTVSRVCVASDSIISRIRCALYPLLHTPDNGYGKSSGAVRLFADLIHPFDGSVIDGISSNRIVSFH